MNRELIFYEQSICLNLISCRWILDVNHPHIYMYITFFNLNPVFRVEWPDKFILGVQAKGLIFCLTRSSMS